MSAIAAVVFDIGGVVQDSPLHVIARYEQELGLMANAINRVVVAVGERGAGARLERGGVTTGTSYPPSDAACCPHGPSVDSRPLMARIAEATAPRPRMLEPIQKLRASGRKVAALTNNWVTEPSRRGPFGEGTARARLDPYFDVFVE